MDVQEGKDRRLMKGREDDENSVWQARVEG